MKFRTISVLVISFLISIVAPSSYAMVKGIYLNLDTSVNTPKVEYLIKNAKAVGINTFVVDYAKNSPAYERNIKLIKDSGIKYVARIVIFPLGGTPDQIYSQAYINKRLAQIKQAIQLGADQIQLDYIRFKPTQSPSPKNAEKIASIIQYFKQNAAKSGIPIQVDVFGISSFKPSVYIGQNVALIAQHVDAICPMVYPSHYEPFLVHAKQPYKTVYDSLVALKKQIQPYPNVKVIAFIELFNYRYPMSDSQRRQYILAELKAVKDADAQGWYFWSAGNHYDILFSLLREKQDNKLAVNN